MFHSKRRVLGVTLLLFLTSGVATLKGVEPLRYDLKSQQKFGYEVTLIADLASKIDTYQGYALYEVKAVNGESFNVTFSGGLTGSSANKNKNAKEPAKLDTYDVNTFSGLKLTSCDLVVGPRGQVVSMKEKSQLPFMLGNLSLLVFEEVPDDDPSSWTVEGGVGITEKKEGSGPGGPPFGRPGGGRGIPGGKHSGMGPRGNVNNNTTEKTTAATTVEDFTLQKDANGKAVYRKKYTMKAPGEETMNVDGTGTWTFDRAQGISDSLDFSQKISVTKGNASLNIPVKVRYRSLSAEEIAKVENDRIEAARKAKEDHEKFWADVQRKKDEAKALEQAPLTPAEKADVLATLKRGNRDERIKKFEMLKKKSLAQPDPDIVAAIREHIDDKDLDLRKHARQALSQWDAAFKKKYEIMAKYGPENWSGHLDKGSGIVVEPTTKLVPGQIVSAKFGGHWWRVAAVTETLPDGRVNVIQYGKKEVTSLNRIDINLAPPEAEQPPEVARQLALNGPKPVMRIWTDSSGTHKIEAEMLAFADGKVMLRRKDGVELSLPLDKLSVEDQQFVKKPPAKPANPFEKGE